MTHAYTLTSVIVGLCNAQKITVGPQPQLLRI